jgi:MerR family transcriptional regulator/heat shock protein HspR
MDIQAEKHHTIGEAADIMGIAISTLRMYEREGLVLPYRRSSKHRRYSWSDIERIRCIRRMIRDEKISIAGIRRILSLIPCWRVKGCPPEVREACPAFDRHDGPCWTMSQKPWECRNSDCRACSVYTSITDCQTLKRTIASIATSRTSAQMHIE